LKRLEANEEEEEEKVCGTNPCEALGQLGQDEPASA